jgi:hypothetical protein
VDISGEIGQVKVEVVSKKLVVDFTGLNVISSIKASLISVTVNPIFSSQILETCL